MSKSTLQSDDSNSEEEEEHPLCLAVASSPRVLDSRTVENQAEALPSERQTITMPRNQDETTERLCLKRKAMEPVGRTKFIWSLTKHEDKINEVLLEVMTAT